ncbi:DUF123 domain-containing protein [Haloquadratum walsbyi]|jgi:Uncharacterized conserved protein|uniref:GIY-YIG domain-containing protein n=1 Tax=Haloquadratum walsbyi J07HQW2 TaxID=1238425 RepID=U1PQX5_9EURY|nr:GIY-YIG nuclease family protein [Haloquadratum walsbyi]ERG94736.1 MAG: hypothetical protein J07HQW2_01177 [Haloquadratum walsbyi J07HQW2]
MNVAVITPAAIQSETDPLGIGAGTAPPGSYVLCMNLDSPTSLTVGVNETRLFPQGGYAYVGSAFGSNGLGRVDRHRRVAAGIHDVTHWHIDYLASHQNVSLTAIVTAPTADIECAIASSLLNHVEQSPLDGFGSSDCTCMTHLFRSASAADIREQSVTAIQELTPPNG